MTFYSTDDQKEPEEAGEDYDEVERKMEAMFGCKEGSNGRRDEDEPEDLDNTEDEEEDADNPG